MSQSADSDVGTGAQTGEVIASICPINLLTFVPFAHLSLKHCIPLFRKRSANTTIEGETTEVETGVEPTQVEQLDIEPGEVPEAAPPPIKAMDRAPRRLLHSKSKEMLRRYKLRNEWTH